MSSRGLPQPLFLLLQSEKWAICKTRDVADIFAALVARPHQGLPSVRRCEPPHGTSSSFSSCCSGSRPSSSPGAHRAEPQGLLPAQGWFAQRVSEGPAWDFPRCREPPLGEVGGGRVLGLVRWTQPVPVPRPPLTGGSVSHLGTVGGLRGCCRCLVTADASCCPVSVSGHWDTLLSGGAQPPTSSPCAGLSHLHEAWCPYPTRPRGQREWAQAS